MAHKVQKRVKFGALIIAAGLIGGVLSFNTQAFATSTCPSGSICLYYSADEAGAFHAFTGSVADLNSVTFNSSGSDGAGLNKYVRNNAHSIWNNSTNLTATVYYSPSYTGTSQVVSPGFKGNLNAGLINNDASIYVSSSTSTVTVSFNGNGATSGTAPGAQSGAGGVSMTVPGPGTLAKTGYTFSGWNTSTGTTYPVGAVVRFTTTTILYAKWTPLPTVTVSFNGNTATSGAAPGSQSGPGGVSVTMPGPGTLAKTGYTFSGWNTKTDGTGTPYPVGAVIRFTTTTPLYAKWTPSTVTVSFNGNGATSGTAPGAQSGAGGVSLTLPGPGTLAKTGYTFAGWNTNTAGTGTTYPVGAVIRFTTTTVLYAKWTPLPTVTVSFNGNGATSGTAPGLQSGPGSVSVTMPGPGTLARTGYTFAGWNTNTAGTGTPCPVGAVIRFTTTTPLYAQWTYGYLVTYNANGGTSAPAAQMKIPGTLLKLSGAIPTLRGFQFLGWSVSSAATTATYPANGGYAADAPANLYAIWKAEGGTWKPTSPPPSGGIVEQIYMPKDVAQGYYNVISNPTSLNTIAKDTAQYGAGVAAGLVATALGVSTFVAGAVVAVYMLGVDLGNHANLQALLDRISACPANGFVVIEYYLVVDKFTGVTSSIVQYSNAASVDPTGTFLEGVFLT